MRAVSPQFGGVLLGLFWGLAGAGFLGCGSSTTPRKSGAAATSGELEPASNRTRIVRTLELSGERRFSYRVDCRRDNDCALATIHVDCCGSIREIGVRAGEGRDLERRVEASAPFKASCECLALPTELDDGSEAEIGAAISVRCEQAECRSVSTGSLRSTGP